VQTSFESRLKEYKTRVDTRITEILNEQHPVDLYEPMRYALQAGGKRLRPVLLLAACDAVGGDVNDALDVAAALEIVHNFTLVHDDIMDRDETRRGRETVYRHWDENVAILSGDGLLVKAYAELKHVSPDLLPDILTEFSRGILKVCEGQTLDMNFENRHTVSLDEYFEMIRKKTAAFFSLACQLGGMLGRGSPEQIEALAAYGLYLGIAFQVQDDLLDIVSDTAVLGKDAGSDIKAGKKTFLMLHALANGTPQQIDDLRAVIKKENVTETDINVVRELFLSIGSMQMAAAEIKRSLAVANQTLQLLQPGEGRTFMKDTLKLIENRTF